MALGSDVPHLLRVESDGSIRGTRVYNAMTNEDISGHVCKVEYVHEAGKTPVLKVTLLGAIIDVTSFADSYEVRTLVNPLSKEAASG